MRAMSFLFVLLLVLALPVATASAESWKFIVTGDSRGDNNGVNTTILAEIAAEVVRQAPEFIIFSGDLVSGYTTEANLESQLRTWRNTMQPVYNAGIGVYPVRGNHEKGAGYSTTTAWNNVFSGAYSLPQDGPAGEKNLTWSVTHGTGSGKAIVLGLDQYYPSNDHKVPQAWVDDKLAATDAPHVFATGHEPAFSSDHNDCLDDAPGARNDFINSLIDAGGRSYFAGHDHFYNHLRADDGDGNLDNDLHQFIVGTAGAPLRSEGDYGGNTGPWTPTKDIDGDGFDDPGTFERQYGYMVVEIDVLDVTMTWWRRTGANTYAATSEGLSYSVLPRIRMPLVMNPAAYTFTMPSDPGPHSLTISLAEGERAKGDVTVTLTYDEAVVNVFSDEQATSPIASGGTATIADGTPSVTVYVTGIAIGSTQLVASADDYPSGRADYSVRREIALSITPSDDPGSQIDPATTPLVLDDEYILTVSVDPPVAGAGSMILTIDYDGAFLTIEEPAIIGGGNASLDLTLTAKAATVDSGVWGPPATVTVSATDEYAPISVDYDIGFEPGDATSDNCVNVQDLLMVRANLGDEGSQILPRSADVNRDGACNVLDLLAVRAHLGHGSGCPE